MTNEEMAERIKTGQGEYINALWDNVKRAIYQLALRYYNGHVEYFQRKGYEVKDVIQECYFIYLKTLEAYNGEYKFTSYITFTMQNHFARALNNDRAMNGSISMETPLGGDDDDLLLGDILKAPGDLIQEAVDGLYSQEFIKDLMQVVAEKLTEDEIKAFEGVLLCGYSFTQLSALYGWTQHKTRDTYHRALRKIRYDRRIKQYYFDLDIISSTAYNGGLGAWKNSSFTSSTEKTVFKLNSL